MEQDDNGTLGLETRGIENLGLERGGLVTARGTAEGLVLRLDGRVDHDSLKDALDDFMVSRKAFLAGNEVMIEWVGQKPEGAFIDELSRRLSRDFNINVKSSKLREHQRVSFTEADLPVGAPAPELRAVDSQSQKTLSLFDGIEALRLNSDEGSGGGSHEEKGRYAGSAAFWDDPDSRIVYTTLRSGQKIETEHSLVVFGDVNSGAEVIAGGDIIVLGTLRGVAHAGAYDETGGGRVIFALKLNPTQLRIGMVISQGAAETQNVPEIARVDGNLIVVEPYMARAGWNRRRD
jgi:septum site-determining protein MinC